MPRDVQRTQQPSIFDNHEGKKLMMLNKSSRLSQRLVAGKSRKLAANNIVGALKPVGMFTPGNAVRAVGLGSGAL